MQLQLKLQGNQRRNNHSNVSHPILKARINKGLTIAQVCRLTNLSYDNYIKYEQEKVKPQYMCLETLSKISKVLGIDLLSEYHTFKINSSKHIRKYMLDNHLSIRKAALAFGVSAQTVKNWLNGKCSPSYEMWETYFKQT